MPKLNIITILKKRVNPDNPESIMLPLVIGVAVLKQTLTLLSYGWYAGIDSYSYDVAGLQLVSGYVFDLFPILFRAPVMPVAKNILYLVFEGQPYFLSIVLHSLGVFSVYLAYRLGSRFSKTAGFLLGMLLALNLPFSAHFHHISSVTFFVPLLLLSADRFIVWTGKPGKKSLVFLTLTAILSFLARTEAIILIPVFTIFGWMIHRRLKHAVLFFLLTLAAYNSWCLFNYVNFGYWDITYMKGFSLFKRISRSIDLQFDISNGPASRKLYEYMRKWFPGDYSPEELNRAGMLVRFREDSGMQLSDFGLSKEIGYLSRQMYTLNFAQKDLGYFKADDLFFEASMESIRSDYKKFIKFTLLRILGHLEIYSLPGLSHREFPTKTPTGHMYGFDGTWMRKMTNLFERHKSELERIESPIRWQKGAVRARMRRILGLSAQKIKVPGSFKREQNFYFEDGLMYSAHCGDGIMTERYWNWLELDRYFFLGYWGQRGYSETALRILRYWDMLLMPGELFRRNFNRIMWVFWVAGIFLLRKNWRSRALAAFMAIVLFFAVVQAVFSDNYGGRFALHFYPFLWLGGICGLVAVYEKRVKKHKEYLLKRAGIIKIRKTRNNRLDID